MGFPEGKTASLTLKHERTCVGCFKKFLQGQLLAIKRLKNGEVVVDSLQKIPGRGVYLCRNISCLKRTKDRKGKNGLEYGLKVKIPETVWAEVQSLII